MKIGNEHIQTSEETLTRDQMCVLDKIKERYECDPVVDTNPQQYTLEKGTKPYSTKTRAFNIRGREKEDDKIPC